MLVSSTAKNLEQAEFENLEEVKDPWEEAAVEQDYGKEQDYGEEDFADAHDYESLREDIRKAREECDEVKLSVAIDLAKALGNNYPYSKELDDAEDHLYELMQCPYMPPEGGSSPIPDQEADKSLPACSKESAQPTDETTHDP